MNVLDFRYEVEGVFNGEWGLKFSSNQEGVGSRIWLTYRSGH
jgi:hypothetical protein